jgi:rod shape determining protein RodA
MREVNKVFVKDILLSLSIISLLALSTFVLSAISPGLFPSYFIYIVASLFAFYVFSKIDFEVLSLFSWHFYILSICLLVTTLFIGSVTRGAVRWIPLGTVKLQPAEIVRPFLILFFANYLVQNKVTLSHLVRALFLLFIPTVLILVQPSLGVSILTVIGFVGVTFSISFEKRYILVGFLMTFLVLPLFWFVLQPYQRQRVETFLNPASDPRGAGYNSIQSMIAIGSGKFFGRNLGEGVQTQLAFLPEKQTDFIFAAISEELGFVGSFLVLAVTFLMLWRLTIFIENAVNPVARAYLSGFLLTIFVEIVVHVGMNLGLLPVAGLPYPLVSAGGSSLLSTMMGLGIALQAYRR